MGKRRSSIDHRQIGFTFEPPSPARMPAQLAGLGRQMSGMVALALKDDQRSREEIAGAMSALLDEPVTKMMLDAYASESREGHSVAAHRLLALIAVTERFDLLDMMARKIGASILYGDQLITAELGNIDRQMAKLRERKKTIQNRAPVFERNRDA